MGLISKVLAAKLSSKMMDRALRQDQAQQAAPTGEYIPANQPEVSSGRLGSLTNRATQIYRDNPKLVGGIATLAAAALLVGLKQGRISFRR